jgi:hypothetical protein
MCDDAFSQRFLPREELEAALEAAGKRVDVMWSKFVSPESFPLFFGMFREVLSQGEEGREGGRKGASVERFVNLVEREKEEERQKKARKKKMTKKAMRKRSSVTCLLKLAAMTSPYGGHLVMVLTIQPMPSLVDVWAAVVGGGV